MNAIQAEKKMDKILKKYNLINDVTAIIIKNFLTTCIYTTQLYELDAIELMKEYCKSGSLSLNKYNL
ncbi:hypothetical protein MT487_01315 [Lachnospiraceae bacterium NSJ-171]|nr:hypothetical protein [Lachnospiraceae bacterium NSJ-171]DAZ44335.1 MAG TPA: hypothetical protein [Caudoviricetes sp.]